MTAPVDVLALLDAYAADGTKGEIKANARLIAAAPDLLEALRLAMVWVEPIPRGDPLRREYEANMSFIRAAIAKATGAHS